MEPNPELFERALHVCRLLTMVMAPDGEIDRDTLEEAIEAAFDVTTTASEEG